MEFEHNSFECNIFSLGSKLRRDATQVLGEVEFFVYEGGLFSHYLNNIANEN